MLRFIIKILLENIIIQNIEYIDIKFSELKSDISHDRKKVCTLIIYQKPILHFMNYEYYIFSTTKHIPFSFLLRTQWIKMRLECKPDTNINIHFSEADMQIILLNIIMLYSPNFWAFKIYAQYSFDISCKCILVNLSI